MTPSSDYLAVGKQTKSSEILTENSWRNLELVMSAVINFFMTGEAFYYWRWLQDCSFGDGINSFGDGISNFVDGMPISSFGDGISSFGDGLQVYVAVMWSSVIIWGVEKL